MTVVIHASVALKWVIDEAGSAAATQLLLDEALAAPDFLIVECANVLWTAERRRRITRDQARAALASIQAAPLQLFGAASYVAAAHSLAFELSETVYDALYLALALAERAVLVTADRAFAEAVMRHSAYRSSVKLLA